MVTDRELLSSVVFLVLVKVSETGTAIYLVMRVTRDTESGQY